MGRGEPHGRGPGSESGPKHHGSTRQPHPRAVVWGRLQNCPFYKGVRSLSPQATSGWLVCMGFHAVSCGQTPPLTDTPTGEWQGLALCPGLLCWDVHNPETSLCSPGNDVFLLPPGLTNANVEIFLKELTPGPPTSTPRFRLSSLGCGLGIDICSRFSK